MKTTLYLLPIMLIACCCGCASYEATSLPILQSDYAPYSQDQNDVTVMCKPLTAWESKRYLGRDVQSKGYQPIQICIRNDGKSYYLLSPQSINLPVAPPEEVAQLVHTNTVGRAAGWGVAGLFVWPLLVPAVVDGVGSYQANQRLDDDYSRKGVQQTVIQPGTIMNRVIFTPMQEYPGYFRLTLLNRDTRDKLVYEVAFAPSQNTPAVAESAPAQPDVTSPAASQGQ
jgi:hypothetical protein